MKDVTALKEAARTKHVDQDYAFERVLETSRKGFWPMLFIMLGFTFCSSSMTVGSKLGNGLGLAGYLLATVIGGIVLAAYTVTLGYIGSSSGFIHCAAVFNSLFNDPIPWLSEATGSPHHKTLIGSVPTAP